MSFHDSTRFIFEFLLKLAHISRLKVFMQDLRFLDFYMSNDPKLELELRKLAEFRLVRFLVERTVRGLWADSPPFMRIVYQRSCQPQKFIADSPPKDRGQSAYAGQILPEAVSVGWQCENSKADGPLGYRGQSANGQKGGS